MTSSIHAFHGFFMRRFRPARIVALRAMFPLLDADGSVVDVGGAADWWLEARPATRNITVVNLDTEQEAKVEGLGYRFVVADGRDLPFPDASFDLAFSNSTIEHVGDAEAQRRFAAEMMRCGRQVYLQTPNRWFPVEPHLIAPFIHWLPRAILRRLARWCSVWGWVTRPDQREVDDYLDGLRLLTRHELERFFPGGQIRAEKVMGLTKSFIVTRAPAPALTAPEARSCP